MVAARSERLKASRVDLLELAIGLLGAVQRHAAVQIMISEVEHAEHQHFGILRDFRSEAGLAEGQPHFARALQAVVFVVHRIGVNARVVRVAFKQRAHGVVRAQFEQIHAGRFDELLVNRRAVAMLGNIALGERQLFEEALLDARRRTAPRPVAPRGPAYWITCTVSMPDSSSKNQPQLVYISMAWRCISSSFQMVTRSPLLMVLRRKLAAAKRSRLSGERSRMTWM